MGYVATVVVNVDALHMIKEDKDFGKKVHDAVLSVGNSRNNDNIPSGGHTSAATVIEKHHSSHAVPVLVGGYRDCVVGNVSVDYTKGADTELEVLKQLAAKHGYSLRKNV